MPDQTELGRLLEACLQRLGAGDPAEQVQASLASQASPERVKEALRLARELLSFRGPEPGPDLDEAELESRISPLIEEWRRQRRELAVDSRKSSERWRGVLSGTRARARVRWAVVFAAFGAVAFACGFLAAHQLRRGPQPLPQAAKTAGGRVIDAIETASPGLEKDTDRVVILRSSSAATERSTLIQSVKDLGFFSQVALADGSLPLTFVGDNFCTGDYKAIIREDERGLYLELEAPAGCNRDALISSLANELLGIGLSRDECQWVMFEKIAIDGQTRTVRITATKSAGVEGARIYARFSDDFGAAQTIWEFDPTKIEGYTDADRRSSVYDVHFIGADLDHDGTRELITTWMSQKSSASLIAILDPATGEARAAIWNMGHFGAPYVITYGGQTRIVVHGYANTFPLSRPHIYQPMCMVLDPEAFLDTGLHFGPEFGENERLAEQVEERCWTLLELLPDQNMLPRVSYARQKELSAEYERLSKTSTVHALYAKRPVLQRGTGYDFCYFFPCLDLTLSASPLLTWPDDSTPELVFTNQYDKRPYMPELRYGLNVLTGEVRPLYSDRMEASFSKIRRDIAADFAPVVVTPAN